MRLLRGGLVALGLASLLAGCGISAGPVQVEGHPNDLAVGRETNPLVSLARPDQARDAEELVLRFLAATADDEQTRPETLRSYLEQPESWKPGDKLNVVRILEGPKEGAIQPDGTIPVAVTIQRIGVLTDEGLITPVEWAKEELKFSVVRVGSAGLFLQTPPSTELFLLDESLDARYDTRQLYFRTASGRFITDLRYVPRHYTEAEQADKLVNWLYDGPAAWLSQTVVKLPPATRPTSTVVTDDEDNLVVSLAAPPTENERDLIAEQLYRTLVTPNTTGLEITIQGQPLRFSPPSATPRYTPGRYAVVDGQVVRLRVAGRGEGSLNIPAAVNKDVVAVAFSRGEEAVALVRKQGSASTLWAGPVGRPEKVKLPGDPQRISQPVWLDQRSKLLLVLADGKLFQLVLGGVVTQVQGVSNVEAMAVAPDGYRMALVTEGKLRMAVLVRLPDGPISVGTPQLVPTSFTRVHNVAFAAESELAVAGTDAVGMRIAVMNLDGGLESPRGEVRSASLQVNQLVADPQSGAILYEIKDGNSYELFETSSELLWHNVVRPGSPAEVRVSAPSFEG